MLDIRARCGVTDAVDATIGSKHGATARHTFCNWKLSMATTEITERINRHNLVRLLDTMGPVEGQAITHRTKISDLEAALASERPPSARRYARPASHVAAMLPAVNTIHPRLARTVSPDLSVHERVTVAVPPLARPARELETYEELAQLSPQVLALLTEEELAMLPPHLQPMAMPPKPVGASPVS